MTAPTCTTKSQTDTRPYYMGCIACCLSFPLYPILSLLGLCFILVNRVHHLQLAVSKHFFTETSYYLGWE